MNVDQAEKIIIKVATAIFETIKESPNGAPLGPMYAACMTTGMSLDHFMAIINGLQDAKRIKVVGDVAYAV